MISPRLLCEARNDRAEFSLKSIFKKQIDGCSLSGTLSDSKVKLGALCLNLRANRKIRAGQNRRTPC